MILRPQSLFRTAFVILSLTGISNCGGTPTDGGGSEEDCAALSLAACGTVCVDTNSDTANCGICGVVCEVWESCTNGACVSSTGSGGLSGVGGTGGTGGGRRAVWPAWAVAPAETVEHLLAE